MDIAGYFRDVPLSDVIPQAKKVLEELFSAPFDDHNADAESTKKVLTEIFYGLYYGDIQKDRFSKYLIPQIYAEKGHVDLSRYSEEEKLRLLAYLFSHKREGTFTLIHAYDAHFSKLIDNLIREYYDAQLFNRLVSQNLPLEVIEKALEEKALLQTEEFYFHFNSLVKNLIANTEDIYKGLLEIAKNDQERQIATRQQQIVRAGFAPYLARGYSFEDFHAFTKTFGLTGYPSIYKDAFSETTSLVEKIKNLDMIVKGLIGIRRSIASLMRDELQSILSFVFAIIIHLQRVSDDKGCIPAIATCKELSKQFALQTIVSGYANFFTKKYPIVVYDQSDAEQFEKNRQFIATLQANVVHVSKKDASLIAKKFGADKLLETHPSGSFGYGGARNCQFLLTGLIARHSIDELLSLPDQKVKELFLDYGIDELLLIVDDDMYISDTNILSQSIFAKNWRNDPVGCVGYQLGRASKYNLFYWGIEAFLGAPERTTIFPQWIDYQTLAGMSESVLKPKICLNLPQGNEENHYLSMAVGHFFLKPSYHLSGSRFPEKEFPTHFFVGMEECIEKSQNFVLLLYLTDYLISPNSRYSNTALPWNDKDMSARFSGLKEGLYFIAHSKEELKSRFWRKLEEFFWDERQEYKNFLNLIKEILQADIDKVCEDFQQKNTLMAHEKDSLRKLADVYKRIQSDVDLFWKSGKELARTKDPEFIKEKISNTTPLTEGLYLMAHSIGKAEFVDTVAAIVHT